MCLLLLHAIHIVAVVLHLIMMVNGFPLPPTLQLILWDYGSLSKEQERQYIDVKMKMFDHAMTDLQLTNLSNCIVNSQELMRDYAFQQLKPKYGDAEAKRRSHSCVSQRDNFTFTNGY